MQVIGKIMIFRKEYNGKNVYSTNISNKDINGEYTNMYISVQLPKGIELENKTNIEITKGFLSFYSAKDGSQKLKLVIMDFENNTNSPVNNEESPVFAENLPF